MSRSGHARQLGLAFAAATLIAGCGPDLTQFEGYREARIETWPAKQMLVVELQGKASETAGRAIGTLMRAFHQLDGADVGLDAAGRAPRARWKGGLDTPQDQWVGLYGLQVADGIKELPADFAKLDPPVRLETWTYGDVAVVLHTGGYDVEKPTVDGLHAFIPQHGRAIGGLHEEIYLKGPGMFMKGDPAGYKTLILYPVVAAPPPSPPAPAAPPAEPGSGAPAAGTGAPAAPTK